jgi:hypothetical protein
MRQLFVQLAITFTSRFANCHGLTTTSAADIADAWQIERRRPLP